LLAFFAAALFGVEVVRSFWLIELSSTLSNVMGDASLLVITFDIDVPLFLICDLGLLKGSYTRLPEMLLRLLFTAQLLLLTLRCTLTCCFLALGLCYAVRDDLGRESGGCGTVPKQIKIGHDVS
jgi:hypothetical protein